MTSRVGGASLPEWIVDLWSNNRDALFVTVIGGVIVTLINVVISHRIAPSSFRRRKLYRNKKARLEAKLEEHLDGQEYPIRAVTRIFLTLVLRSSVWAAYLILVAATYLVMRGLEGIFSLAATKPPNPVTIALYTIFVAGNIFFYLVSASLDLYRLRSPKAYTKHLEKQIRQLEEDEALIA